LRLRREDLLSAGSLPDEVFPGGPRRGSPQAVLLASGILRDDADFARAMNEVLRERDLDKIEAASAFDELSK
jgi:hypothetical protein